MTIEREVQRLELEIGGIHPTYLKPFGKIERLWAVSSAQEMISYVILHSSIVISDDDDPGAFSQVRPIRSVGSNGSET